MAAAVIQRCYRKYKQVTGCGGTPKTPGPPTPPVNPPLSAPQAYLDRSEGNGGAWVGGRGRAGGTPWRPASPVGAEACVPPPCQFALYQRMTQAAILIQSKFRSYAEQKRFQRRRRAAVLIQQRYRSHREHQRLQQGPRAPPASLPPRLRWGPAGWGTGGTGEQWVMGDWGHWVLGDG